MTLSEFERGILDQLEKTLARESRVERFSSTHLRLVAGTLLFAVIAILLLGGQLPGIVLDITALLAAMAVIVVAIGVLGVRDAQAALRRHWFKQWIARWAPYAELHTCP